MEIRLGHLRGGKIALSLLFGCTAFAQTTLTPATLAFGSQVINEASVPKTATFKNTQAVALTIENIGISGADPADYVPGGNCPLGPSALGAGQSCSIAVTFTPAGLGSRTATLTVTHSAATSPQTVALTGTGITPVTLSVSTLAFGSLAVGDTSAAQTVTLTNHENVTLTFSEIAAGAGYAVASNTCGATIVAGATCKVAVTFSPTATGADPGTLTFTDNAVNSPQTVSLTATGITPVTLSATTLNFGYEAEGTSSAAKTVTLTNHENVALNFTSIATNAGFAVASNTCSPSIAAGATCTVGVTFSSTAAGASAGSLTFTDNAVNSPQTVGLTATGITPATLSATALNFGYEAEGTSSAAKIVTLTNHENVALNFSSIATNAEFAVASNTCSPSIAAAATCTVGVTFSPTAAGASAGSLTFIDNAVNSPQTVSLTGDGITPVTLSVGTLAFGTDAVGNTSAAKTVTLTNHENVALNFTSIVASAEFAVAANTCSPSIAAGAACTVGVTFSPTAAGASAGSLTFIDNSVNSPQTVSLTGNGITPVTLSVSTLAFGTEAVGNTSAAKTVTLTNHENVALNFTSIVASAEFAVAANTCSPRIAAGATCTVGVTYSPTSTEAVTGALTFTDDAAGSLQTVSLTGPGPARFLPTGGLNTARDGQTATLLNNGMVLIAGGNSGFLFFFDLAAPAELYNPATSGFTTTGSLNTARVGHTATLLNNGKVLIAGGDGSGGLAAPAELYNPAAGTFTATGSLNTARVGHTATLLSNGMVLIAGGSDSALDEDNPDSLASGELYNPATGIFTITGSLNSARLGHTATMLNNGMVLIAGGSDSNGNSLASAELYNPATGTFTVTGSLNTARSGQTASMLNNGTVLIAGGSDSNGNSLSGAELYNRATGTFAVTGSLNTARSAHTATLLNNGAVLIADGADFPDLYPLANAELYNPATGTFAVTGAPSAEREDHTSTLLNDGTVLVAGGYNLSGALAAAELYEPASLTPPGLLSITVSPADTTTLSPGTTQQFIAMGTFSGTSPQQLASVLWISSSTAVATVSNDVTNPGLALAEAAGNATITAAAGTVAGQALLTVRPTGSVFTGSLNVARQQQTATLLNNGMVLIAGGFAGTSAELYNPATGAFTLTGSLTFPRILHTATLLNNGMVLIAGGTAVPTAELYNPATGTFTLTGNMSTPRILHTATLLNNGMVLIAGGPGDARAELYNPATGTFTLTGYLNAAREGHTATLLNNGMVLIAGGVSKSAIVSTAELYNPATGSFTFTGSLNDAREYQSATLLSNGKLLIAGGLGASAALTSAELYNPATGTFTYTGSLKNAREYQTATLLNSGMVLMAGGYNGSALASAELYNPASGSFTLTGSLNTVREYQTAILLRNGMVLIAGGYNNSAGYLASAELY